ncbi:phytanoyl-CoA dioxygenase family protein [Rhizobium ruizarguesonis]
MEEAFIESRADDPRSVLTRRLHESGYLMLRGCFDPNQVASLHDSIMSILKELKWTAADKAERRAADGLNLSDRDDEHRRAIARIYRLESLHAFVRHPDVRSRMTKLLGTNDLLLHPNIVPRVVFPKIGSVTGPSNRHQDHTAFQGARSAITCWLPLHDCTPADGVVAVAVGSHTKGRYLFGPAPDGGIEIQCPPDLIWHAGDFKRGDALFFLATTLHRTVPNSSEKLRLSLDFRYQAASEPACAPYFCDHAIVVDEPWREVCRHFGDRTILSSICTLPPDICDYDITFLQQREAIAIRQGRAGDQGVKAELENIRTRGTSSVVRKEAASLLEALNRASRSLR